jgi:putative endonuclease
MRKPKHFCVYIMTNNRRSHVLYTGITGDLPRRVFEHKNKVTPGFTSHCNLTRLVHSEMFSHPGDAIKREKEIKGWVRSKKIKLIESANPHWHDLAADWQGLYKTSTVPLPIRARSFAALRPLRMMSSDWNLQYRRTP